MKKEIKQGTKANRNGSLLENTVKMITEQFDFVHVPYSSYHAHKERYQDLPRILLTNVPYVSIYGNPGRTEFVLLDREAQRRIRLEVKSQTTSGSVDEKYPYLFWNAAKAYEEKEIIFLIHGNGMKKGVRSFLQNNIENDTFQFREQGKDIQLMNLDSYFAFLMANFRKQKAA